MSDDPIWVVRAYKEVLSGFSKLFGYSNRCGNCFLHCYLYGISMTPGTFDYLTTCQGGRPARQELKRLMVKIDNDEVRMNTSIVDLCNALNLPSANLEKYFSGWTIEHGIINLKGGVNAEEFYK
jgi:hypothetical protein